ncbi:hypothetical protein Tco_0621766 [Tanacetum coccineum]
MLSSSNDANFESPNLRDSTATGPPKPQVAIFINGLNQFQNEEDDLGYNSLDFGVWNHVLVLDLEQEEGFFLESLTRDLGFKALSIHKILKDNIAGLPLVLWEQVELLLEKS